jgi:hypothetical protein
MMTTALLGLIDEGIAGKISGMSVSVSEAEAECTGLRGPEESAGASWTVMTKISVGRSKFAGFVALDSS